METQPIVIDGRHAGRTWRCHCGAVVESWSGRDTSCDRCGRDYNAFGQELGPPDQWLEDLRELEEQ